MNALTWNRAFELWINDDSHSLSPRHIENVEAIRRRWVKAFGANKSIEETALGAFTTWIRERVKTGKGREVQLDYAHRGAVVFEPRIGGDSSV